jgi:hypothetical protein
MKCHIQIRIPRELVHKQALHTSPKGDKHNYYFGIEFKISLGPLYIIIWNVDVMNDFQEHRIAYSLYNQSMANTQRLCSQHCRAPSFVCANYVLTNSLV